MAQQPRQLVNRWRWGVISDGWDRARVEVASSLRELSRVLGILHSAVEYPPSQWVDRMQCTADTNITVTSATDITGASATLVPDVDMRLMVQASFDAQCTLFGAATHAFIAWVDVNGVQQTPLCVSGFSALNDRRNITRGWVLSLKSGTSYTIKLRAQTSNVGSNYVVYASQTDMIWEKSPNTYQVP